MAKKYNLLSKSDMRRFQRDLEKTVKKEAESAILKGKYNVTCQFCGVVVTVPVGRSSCPHCHNGITLKLT